jgi:lactoylglutathione lyase
MTPQEALVPTLSYIIEFVGDMDRAFAFYRDVVGLPPKFQSPGWSEFSTGPTTLALHPASDQNPVGKLEIGFEVPDVATFYDEMRAKGLTFAVTPKKQDYGGVIAQFLDSEGATVTVSGRSQ